MSYKAINKKIPNFVSFILILYAVALHILHYKCHILSLYTPDFMFITDYYL